MSRTFIAALLIALLTVLAAPRIASADSMPGNVHGIDAKYHLSWDADALEGYAVYACAWKIQLRDDAKATRVDNGAVVDHRYLWSIALFATKGEIEGNATVAKLKALEDVATGSFSVSRYEDESSPIYGRTTHLAISEIKDGKITLEITRVIETDKDGEVLSDSGEGEPDDGDEGDDGDDEDSDGDGIPHGDETSGFEGRQQMNTALTLLVVAGLAAIGLAIAFAGRFRA